MRRFFLPVLCCSLFLSLIVTAQQSGEYVKKGTRSETVRATLKSFGLPNLEGTWYYAGPFDNTNQEGFDKAYPPEKGFDAKAEFVGKGAARFGWKEFENFSLGKVVNLLPLFPRARNNSVVYLYHEFESPRDMVLPISLGSDDSLSVWVNGKRLLHENYVRPASADQDRVDAKLVAGKNSVLIKVGQVSGDWAVYVSPESPPSQFLPETIRRRIDRDFPPKDVVTSTAGASAAESRYYQMFTMPVPEECVLEVGGLAFRPDGKLLVCTRRGEIWVVENPEADSPDDIRFRRFTGGLHEALGMHVIDNNSLYVVQRPELSKLTDTNGDGIADKFETVCDKWGVSGDYHEYAFGPAVDKDGKFFITLNVGFGGGHQAKAAWRGWCVKVDPKTGEMEPWAYGLRSPNGVTVAPDGEIFFSDNQGEWLPTNKLHHVQRGKFYGHQASLKWLQDSPFAGKASDKVPSGMRFDGGAVGNIPEGTFPEMEPASILLPYGRMGQSTSEPVWDTTDGKFGPFAGQCFVGDQTRSIVMRVAMEKVNGVYQGAAFPFRSGFQCGVNRLTFGPDGSLYVGQTSRGWGSVGGKPYGLQRLRYTGELPMEIHNVSLTPDGFDLTFTKPVDPKTVKDDAVSALSFTYLYSSRYGGDEVDKGPETVKDVRLSEDGMTVSFRGPNLRKGRVYEIRLLGITSADGDPVVHPEAYYTINELR